MPGRGSGSSDTSSSSVPEQQEARYRGLEWRTASKKGERDMRERGMDHGSRSLAGLLVVVIVGMGAGGGARTPHKKPRGIAVAGGASGGHKGVGAAGVQQGEHSAGGG